MEIEDYASSSNNAVSPTTRALIRDLARMPPANYDSPEKFVKVQQQLARKYKVLLGKKGLLDAFSALQTSCPDEFVLRPELRAALVVRGVRSDSGIINVSVVTPPEVFSCRYNCKFCPAEPGMPRSYLSNEDAIARAASVGFDAVRQAWSRFDTLEANGHALDKIEYRVLGGTFSCYPHSVADVFIRDLYYAANTYYDREAAEPRARESMEEEQQRNVSAAIHVVGLGVETRPDEINAAEIMRFRRYGVTRVELGVQHTNDDLLRRLNRGHGVKASRAAIALLKDYGFKVEIHIMADLPGSTPELDKDCYTQVLRTDPWLIPDYLKDYPCLDVDFTELKLWKADGRWKPYAEATPDARDLKDVLIYRQKITPPWVRVNRIQRDFRPATPERLGFHSAAIKTNLAQLVKDEAEAQGIYCQCIRCCEIRHEKFDASEVVYKVEKFEASGGREWFISAVVPRQHRDLLLGFLRLRVSPALQTSFIPELRGRVAMVRELHVYGPVTRVGSVSRGAQHLGIGRQLLNMAEWISVLNGCGRLAVISGIGVRGYYASRGFSLRGTYMIKDILYYRVALLLSIIMIIVSFILYWRRWWL